MDGGMERTKMFVEKGLQVGQADGLDWLDVYVQIISKLDPNNMAYQALVQQMLQLQIELATGKSVKIKHLKPLSSNVGGSAPSRFVGRVGCSGFGDLPGVGHFPWAKGEMEVATISYSMMGDRHRCYKDGKDKCILTAGHPACDDCRMKKKTHRGGHRRGGTSHDVRRAKENAGASSSRNEPVPMDVAKNYKLTLPGGTTPSSAGKRTRVG